MSLQTSTADFSESGKNKPPDKESKYFRRWVVAMLKIMPELQVHESKYFYANGIKYTITRDNNICNDFTMTWIVRRNGARFTFKDAFFMKYVVHAVAHIMKLKSFRMYMPHGNELVFSVQSDTECIDYEYTE